MSARLQTRKVDFITLPHLRASILLLTYNQEDFVEDALQSLVSQDITDLEIVVSDDKSCDNTWEIIKLFASQYKGTKTLILNRNAINLGVVGNYFKAFSLASGDLLFTAAGDDISLSTRCSSSIAYWEQFGGKADLVAADAYDIHLDGTILRTKKTDDLHDWDLRKWIVKRPYIFGASHMVTRRLLNAGHLNPLLPYEDQCLMFRALLMGGAIRLSLPLVKHRRGGITQQPKNHSYSIKKEKLLQSSIDTLAECEQMRADASIFDCPAPVLIKIAETSLIAKYAHDILSARNFQEMYRLFQHTTGIPFAKKFRYFHFTAFSRFHNALMQLKHFFNKSLR